MPEGRGPGRGGWLSETEGNRFLRWGSVWIGIWFGFIAVFLKSWNAYFVCAWELGQGIGKDCMWVRVWSVVISGTYAWGELGWLTTTIVSVVCFSV